MNEKKKSTWDDASSLLLPFSLSLSVSLSLCFPTVLVLVLVLLCTCLDYDHVDGVRVSQGFSEIGEDEVGEEFPDEVAHGVVLVIFLLQEDAEDAVGQGPQVLLFLADSKVRLHAVEKTLKGGVRRVTHPETTLCLAIVGIVEVQQVRGMDQDECRPVHLVYMSTGTRTNGIQEIQIDKERQHDREVSLL